MACKTGFIAFGVSAAIMLPASAAYAEWSKAYVFDYFEPAMYYAPTEGVANPGEDCPLGTMPESDWQKLLDTNWRTDEDVFTIMNPENPSRQRDGPYRGHAEDINVHLQPWTIVDPGVFEVVGDYSYGFNLDGDESTGFTAPDGRKGIDNEYYRAIGCLSTWRGPSREGRHAKYVMEGMYNGSFTVVMVVSGEGDDPLNDPNVKVGFYTAMDDLVKDANGGIAEGYTFRVDPSRLQSVVDAEMVDGVLQTREPSFINIRSVDNYPMQIEHGQMRFETAENGDLTGFIGGYRSVNDMYNELAGGGSTFEITMRMDTPAVWYALQRRADWRPREDGTNSYISMAYRYSAKPAYVVTPDGRNVITTAEIIEAPEPTETASAND